MFKQVMIAIIGSLAIIGAGNEFYYTFIWELPTEEEIEANMYAILEECPNPKIKSSDYNSKYDFFSTECVEARAWWDAKFE